MSSDIVIIGGGVIGLCSAYYLRKQGATVTLLDMGDTGNGSSLHNAGYVCPSHFMPLAAPGVMTQALKWMVDSTSPLYIKPRLDLDLVAWGLRFARSCRPDRAHASAPVLRDLLLESRQLYDELTTREGLQFEWTKRGLTDLFITEKGRHGMEHEAAEAAKLGLETRMLDPDGLRAMDPAVEFRVLGGLHFPGDAHLVPAILIRELTRWAESNGVALQRQTSLRSFVAADGRISAVETSRGRVEGKEFVLSGGSWTPGLLRPLGIRMLLQPGTGYSITFDKPAVLPRLPYILTERRIGVTPFSSSLRFAGTMEIAGLTTSINRTRVEAILDAVPLYFRNIPRPSSTDGSVWGGMRPVTPDGVPYIGRYRAYSNLIVATGHAMIGISLGTATGKIVAEIVGGSEAQRDLKPLDPQRFG